MLKFALSDSITICLQFLRRLGTYILGTYALNINILSSRRLIRAIESNILCIDANTYARARTSDISTRGEVAEILVAQVAQVARSPSSFPVLIPLSISLFLSFDTSPFFTPTERRCVRVRCGVRKRK